MVKNWPPDHLGWSVHQHLDPKKCPQSGTRHHSPRDILQASAKRRSDEKRSGNRCHHCQVLNETPLLWHSSTKIVQQCLALCQFISSSSSSSSSRSSSSPTVKEFLFRSNHFKWNVISASFRFLSTGYPVTPELNAAKHFHWVPLWPQQDTNQVSTWVEAREISINHWFLEWVHVFKGPVKIHDSMGRESFRQNQGCDKCFQKVVAVQQVQHFWTKVNLQEVLASHGVTMKITKIDTILKNPANQLTGLFTSTRIKFNTSKVVVWDFWTINTRSL